MVYLLAKESLDKFGEAHYQIDYLVITFFGGTTTNAQDHLLQQWEIIDHYIIQESLVRVCMCVHVHTCICICVHIYILMYVCSVSSKQILNVVMEGAIAYTFISPKKLLQDNIQARELSTEPGKKEGKGTQLNFTAILFTQAV